MKVLISVDMEGITGVVSLSHTDHTTAEYQRFRRLMTADANAAIEGALQADTAVGVAGDPAAPAVRLVDDRPELLDGQRRVQPEVLREVAQHGPQPLGRLAREQRRAFDGDRTPAAPDDGVRHATQTNHATHGVAQTASAAARARNPIRGSLWKMYWKPAVSVTPRRNSSGTRVTHE